jgi:hypothetical protein
MLATGGYYAAALAAIRGKVALLGPTSRTGSTGSVGTSHAVAAGSQGAVVQACVGTDGVPVIALLKHWVVDSPVAALVVAKAVATVQVIGVVIVALFTTIYHAVPTFRQDTVAAAGVGIDIRVIDPIVTFFGTQPDYSIATTR